MIFSINFPSNGAGVYIPVSQNTHPPITRLFISDLSALPDIEPKQHKNIFLKTSFWRQLHINRIAGSLIA